MLLIILSFMVRLKKVSFIFKIELFILTLPNEWLRNAGMDSRQGRPAFDSIWSIKIFTMQVLIYVFVKFIYSEKVTEIWPIFHFLFDINW